MQINPQSKEHLEKIIAAADSVITALSGENDEIHREDSSRMVDAWDWLNDRMAPPAVIKVMAVALLSGMKQKPVFFVEIEGDDWIDAGRIEGKDSPDLGLLPDGINYLYAHPAPELTAIVDRLNLSGYEHEDGEVTPQNAAAVVDILLQQLDESVQCRDTHPEPSIPAAVPEIIPDSVYQVIYQECDGFVDCEANAQKIWAACRASMLQLGSTSVPHC